MYVFHVLSFSSFGLRAVVLKDSLINFTSSHKTLVASGSFNVMYVSVLNTSEYRLCQTFGDYYRIIVTIDDSIVYLILTILTRVTLM